MGPIKKFYTGLAKVSIDGRHGIFIRRRGHLTPKFNITFFIPNLVLNMFMLNNFFRKSVFFGETAKNCCGGADWGSPMCYNFWPTSGP